ncbi:MAG: ergothioneine biosynthesis protein EgtB [Caulobacteraceae bacterium]|nr:ergothioneine biosynthesis protein EgtB [Caulobacteraceae bacterium]
MTRYEAVRARTVALTGPLSAEDQQIQSMPDVSPTKWHLAHMAWFFETFLLVPRLPAYQPFDEQFGFLFNSYYEAVGERWPRPERGLLSRPSLDRVLAYRRHVDDHMAVLIGTAPAAAWPDIEPVLELGLHHEQQHQELILMDIKHVFSLNPLFPAYAAARAQLASPAPPLDWIAHPGGLVEIGHQGATFAFDNEGPRHKTWLDPFVLASRLSTCGEYLAFIEDGGYARPEFWLSDGWAAVRREGWEAPLYWLRQDGERLIFTLSGLRRLDCSEPVSHLSFYEADAFARWSSRRLPTEAEWEVAAQAAVPAEPAPSDLFHPRAAAPICGLQQMIGELWQWTASPYGPYPRYRPPEGPIGEYNGKFMSSQMVLRGGAAVTPADHARSTYRNFFPPQARWAFSGVRLADDA